MFENFGGRAEMRDRATNLEREVACKAEELALYQRAFAKIMTVLDRARAGDLEARVEDWDEYGHLSDGMSNLNRVLDLSDAFVREATGSLDAASSSQFYRKFLPTGMTGSFGSGAETINKTISSMEAAIAREEANLKRITDAFASSVGGLITGLLEAADKVDVVAGTMKTVARENQSLAGAVAAAAEQASANVQTVASAAEELTASVEEIARQVQASSEQAGAASSEADGASHTIETLQEASDTIGKVVGLINEIADQTNLLALNATIEAARAGDAGKGFAVVASEVKSLAKQTATATEDISHQVDAIQGNTSSTVKAVSGIATTIRSLNEIAAAIASATEEQSAATNEISRNIQEASAGTKDVSLNIGKVNAAATQTLESADQLSDAATELGRLSRDLKKRSDSFLNELRN
ncbi:methyl-accepting chemotaxis protein [Kordiimonas gwangyangensis]|uniref:methyl-accepting chemotaxis protein n=1 Tax=Kordiimonas gwangyangensis TaxID=288022 RepID=UPI00037A729A|nr:methyl-accepting chemotaxis protein [Kordiimonas gwangyangensis]